MADHDELQEPLLERLSVTPEPQHASDSKQSTKKRKRGTEPEPAKKSAKKEKNKKSRAVFDDAELDMEIGVNKAFSHMDSQLLADYLAQRTRMYEKDLSSIEWEEKFLPGTFCIFAQRLKLMDMFSKCNSRYNDLGSTSHTRESTWVPREICWKHDEIMVGF